MVQPPETLKEIGALLIRFELAARTLGVHPDDLPAMAELTRVEQEIMRLGKELDDSAQDMLDDYQDIAKIYFDFVEALEIQLGMPHSIDVSHPAILEAIKAIQSKLLQPPATGPGIAFYTPKPCNDPHFLLVMTQDVNGAWVKKADHLWAINKLIETHKEDLAYKALEQLAEQQRLELQALKEAATAYVAYRPSEGSAGRHAAYKALKDLVQPPQAQKAPDAPNQDAPAAS